jgi:hypothetical protein
MTENQLDFATFCIGNVALSLGIPQSKTYKMLKDSGILSDYIIRQYPTLHTFSRQYITNDITSLMRKKGLLQ